MVVLPVTCPIFVGRTEELGALSEGRRRLAQSRGSIVLVGGEAGIGKSRLLAQFLQQSAGGRPRNLATAECRQDCPEPLYALGSIVRSLRLTPQSPNDFSFTARSALRRIVAGPSVHATSDADATHDVQDLYAGLTALLCEYAEKRATIVVLEDIHWADSSTLAFLEYLAPRIDGSRLLVVATHRTEDVERNAPLLRALTRIERLATVRRVVLEPFDREHLRDLVEAALDGRATIDDAAFERILRNSEGNAFFAEELLKDALSFGARRGARLPISIRGSILQRLERLEEPERRIVGHAAVLGLRFDPYVLATIVGRDIEDILPALQNARDAAIFVDDEREPAWLRFRHALTRQVVYDELLTFDKQRLHLRILESLEGSDSLGDGRLYTMAEHAAASGDAARTLAYGERAGHVAWTLGGFAEAVDCFERALAVAEDEADRARLLEHMAFPVAYGG